MDRLLASSLTPRMTEEFSLLFKVILATQKRHTRGIQAWLLLSISSWTYVFISIFDDVVMAWLDSCCSELAWFSGMLLLDAAFVSFR